MEWFLSIKHQGVEMFTETQKSDSNEQDVLVTLSSLSHLTGFPLSMIKKELFGEGSEVQSIRMSRLREVMLKYLDKSLLEINDK